MRPPLPSRRTEESSSASSASSSPLTAILKAWNVRVPGCCRPLRGRTDSTTRASWAVVVMGARERAFTMARAMAREARSSPNCQRMSAISSSGASFTRLRAEKAARVSMRMSSGPSSRKEKPREAVSSWWEETPRSGQQAVHLGNALLGEDAFHILEIAGEHLETGAEAGQLQRGGAAGVPDRGQCPRR